MNSQNIPTEGILMFSDTEYHIRWGEAVPLWYLQQANKGTGQQVVIFAYYKNCKHIVYTTSWH